MRKYNCQVEISEYKPYQRYLFRSLDTVATRSSTSQSLNFPSTVQKSLLSLTPPSLVVLRAPGRAGGPLLRARVLQLRANASAAGPGLPAGLSRLHYLVFAAGPTGFSVLLGPAFRGGRAPRLDGAHVARCRARSRLGRPLPRFCSERRDLIVARRLWGTTDWFTGNSRCDITRCQFGSKARKVLIHNYVEEYAGITENANFISSFFIDVKLLY